MSYPARAEGLGKYDYKYRYLPQIILFNTNQLGLLMLDRNTYNYIPV